MNIKRAGRAYVYLRRMANAVPNPIRENLDYGDGWNKKLDEVREKDEHHLMDYLDQENMADDATIMDELIQTQVYCDTPKNKKYWKEMGDSPAAKDFQDYAKVKCD